MSVLNDRQLKPSRLLGDIRTLIEEARSKIAFAINSGLTMLYWQIGSRINDEILKRGRGKYGKQILATLSQQLVREYGAGFNYSALTRMVKFTEAFPDPKIVAVLWQRVSWSHILAGC